MSSFFSSTIERLKSLQTFEHFWEAVYVRIHKMDEQTAIFRTTSIRGLKENREHWAERPRALWPPKAIRRMNLVHQIFFQKSCHFVENSEPLIGDDALKDQTHTKTQPNRKHSQTRDVSVTYATLICREDELGPLLLFVATQFPLAYT